MKSGFLVGREYVAMLDVLPDADLARILCAAFRAWQGRTAEVDVGVLERAVVAGVAAGAVAFADNLPEPMTNAERCKRYRARHAATRDRHANDMPRHANDMPNVSEMSACHATRDTLTDRQTDGQSSARTRGGTTTRIPSLDVVLQAAEQYNWRQYAPSWTAEQVRDAVREAYSDLVAQGWTDVQGHAVSNWRAYLSKAVSEKKISAARAAVVSCPMGSTEEE